MTGAAFEGVDLDLLADYVGGALLGTPDQDRVADLVATDPAWQAAHEQLAPAMSTVGAMLLDLPAEPMPDDLAARLESLFTAVPEQAGGAGGEAQPVPAKVLDLEEHRRDRAAPPGRRRRMRWAAPIGVAAGVLAFAGFGLTQIAGQAQDNGADSTVETDAGAAAAPMMADSPQILHSGTDYTTATLDLVAAEDLKEPRAITGSGAPGSGNSDSGVPGAPDSGAPGAPGSGASGGPGAPGAEGPGEIKAAGRLSRLAAPELLLACLEAIARENAGGPITAELVDYASFKGSPALIVRFSAANGIWAWAVGPDCGTPGAGAAHLEKVPVR
ncbi:hypothetical protein [Actinoplanes sp. GCM10030250]|uniref:hypothetical protein n=1 Tax=Actinoplanes sp. GCM10030250 TaxID=3273376 RepID=UPI003611119B